MTMRKVFALLLAAVLLLTGCGETVQTPEPLASKAPVEIEVQEAPVETDEQEAPEPLLYSVVVASDLHYMAPELTDHGACFRQLMENGDGKVTEYCEEIVDAFLAEVAERKPEALILTGDLSFNGARASHLSLAEKLANLEAVGIPVYVLPGNHDVYRSSCAAYIGDSFESVPGVTGEEFREIYAPFGFDEAISQDTDSLSYLARLNDRTWLLMLDANTIHHYCSLSTETLQWTEEQLTAAREQGVTVLAACHQNLFQHSMFQRGYVLNCADQLQVLLERFGVALFLSGHMHIQHIMTRGAVTEIASSALTMGACQYGLLQVSESSTSYQAVSVDVSAWAMAQGSEDENLLHFADYALSALNRRTRSQAEAQLEGKELSEEDLAALADYACALNQGYFTGDLSLIPSLDPDGELQRYWEDAGSFFSSYFASIRPDIGRNYRVWDTIN